MKDVFRISDSVELLPVWHGSGMFMREVRRRILESGCDCLAVCLPPEFRSTVEAGLHKLPYITVSALQEDETTISLVPVDPTQPVIAGLRIAQQENIRREFIDLPLQSYEPRKVEFPDPYALREMSLERFAVTLLPWIQKPAPDSQH
ncbi:MAG: hypothetical protein ACE5ER_07585, partial [Nitrospinaceae bacterium]